MIKFSLFLVFMLFGLIMVFLSKYYKDKDLEHVNDILRLLKIAAIVNFVYALSFLTLNVKLYALTSFSAYGINLILEFCILTFLYRYTNHKLNKYIANFSLVLIIFNAILVLSNLFKPWLVTVTKEVFFDEVFIMLTPIKGFSFHLILPLLMLIGSLYYALKESFDERGIFKRRYIRLALLLTISTLVIIYLSFFIFVRINLMIIITSLITLDLTYIVLNYSPKDLAEKIESKLANVSRDAFLVFNREGEYSYSNESANSLFTKTSLKEGLEYFRKKFNCFHDDNQVQRLDLDINGENRYFKLYHGNFKDDNGKLEAYYFVLHDITKEAKLVYERDYMISHDPLTGAYNRDRFLDRAKRLMNEEAGTYYIIATNFENFRLYNELYSTSAGDALLCSIVSYLDNYDKDISITYARMGSDHFGICISKENYEKSNFGENLIEAFKEYEASHVFLKLGIYELKEDEDIFSAFEQSLQMIHYYHNDLTNRIVYYSSTIRYRFIRENIIASAFEESLAKGEFKVYYQPQMNSANYTMFGAEALVRWEHPDLGNISPGEFVPILEKKSVITALDIYVWEEVIKTSREFSDDGYNGLSLSLNISRLDFFHVDVYDTITKLCEKYEVNPNQIKLEVTESAFTSEKQMIIDVLKRFQAKGFLIEMDDFGSGYSSLNTLKEIPFDVMKLDMEFLRNGESNKSMEIIDSIISMAHRIKVPVIAEGIENKDQVEMLLNMECNLLQGYYYSKPLNKMEFYDYVRKHKLAPCLDNYIADRFTIDSFAKDFHKYYGLCPDPVIVVNPILDEYDEMVDLVVIYQNDVLEYKDVLGLGNIVGKNISSLKNGLANDRLTTYKRVLEDKKRLDFTNVSIYGIDTKYSVSMCPIKNSDSIMLLFKAE